MSWISIGASAVTAFGQIQAGQAAKTRGGLEGQQLDYQAGVEHDNGIEHARLIRRQQRQIVGSADAAAAASGVVVGQGSAGEVDRQLYQDTEHDAYQAILAGDRKQREAQVKAVGARTGGAMAAANANLAAVGTVLGGAYQGLRGSGWKSGGAWDPAGYNGTNDRSAFSTGDAPSKFLKYGKGGD